MTEKPLYGPHQLKGKDYPPGFLILDGPIETTCELCGAWSPNFGVLPIGGHNQQEDASLFGMNPLNDEAREISEKHRQKA